ncbi:MAG: SMP-30/gluconolactonase/LRE family protein [Akkermansiaceae bacterium]|nr:SMP-30/gluconolactonase/LRE family protein [Armatimonadota bacterium]
MPLGSALSPDGKTLAVICAGYNDHRVTLLDATTGAVKQSLPLESAWNGIAWARDGATLYVSGGGQPQINVLAVGSDGTLMPSAPILLPDIKGGKERKKTEPQAYVSGLAMSADGKTLFAGNFATDTIYAVRLSDGSVQGQRKLEMNAHPYCLRLSPDGSRLLVTEGALAAIAVLDTNDLTQVQRITTDGHPNDLLFAPDGRLFASCANSDTVLAIDPRNGLTRERIFVSLTPGSPAGAIPSSLALSPDGKTLYVASSGNNAVAVVDVADPVFSTVEGFIPSGWFPTLVAVAPNGQLVIGSGKGMGTGPNGGEAFRKSPPPQVRDAVARMKPNGNMSISRLLHGILSTLDAPTDAQLAAYTKQVYANTPYTDAIVGRPKSAPKPGSNPIPSRLGDRSPIKYVLYIIKENRTYDQVLGDLKDKNGKPLGNGDPALTLFGEEVTPNLHQLAREYVTLDNTFCDGEVSGNGHPWSTGAIGTDIGERSWMMSYSGHAQWALNDIDIFPPAGRIWDAAERAKVPFVSFYNTWTTDNTERNMPDVWRVGRGSRRDSENADVFISELKRYEAQNNMPRFMIMDLPEDHTNGTRPGAFTPRACVASNDLGVGKIVEACSRSKFWKEMAIFVIEDDAQAGPDHVEAHRTTAFVISPYTRTGKVDSTHYSTVSLLRTMELILGIPPMSQYDAAATPMYNAFTNKPDLTPYTLQAPRIDLNVKNETVAHGAAESSAMDFSGPDLLTSVQVDALNRILWHSIKGTHVPYPAIHRRALPLRDGTIAAPDND